MKLSVTAVTYQVSPELEKYARAKVKRLGKVIPRRLRAAASCHIAFTEKPGRGHKMYTCMIELQVETSSLQARESTQHMYAALDIACVHIEHQLADYAARAKKRRLRRLLSGSMHGDWPT